VPQKKVNECQISFLAMQRNWASYNIVSNDFPL